MKNQAILIPRDPTPDFLKLLDDELHDYSFHCPHSDRLYWAKRIYEFVIKQGSK